jgi:hypothetical protein
MEPAEPRSTGAGGGGGAADAGARSGGAAAAAVGHVSLAVLPKAPYPDADSRAYAIDQGAGAPGVADGGAPAPVGGLRVAVAFQVRRHCCARCGGCRWQWRPLPLQRRPRAAAHGKGGAWLQQRSGAAAPVRAPHTCVSPLRRSLPRCPSPHALMPLLRPPRPAACIPYPARTFTTRCRPPPPGAPPPAGGP